MGKRIAVVAVTPVFDDRDFFRVRTIDDADFLELRVAYAEDPATLNFKWLLPLKDRAIVSLRGIRESESVKDPLKDAERIVSAVRKLRLMLEVDVELLEELGGESLVDSLTVVSLSLDKRSVSENEMRDIVGRYAGKAYALKVRVDATDRAFPINAARALSLADNVVVDAARSGVRETALLALLGSRMLYGYAGYKLEYSLSYKTVKLIVSRLEEFLKSLSSGAQ